MQYNNVLAVRMVLDLKQKNKIVDILAAGTSTRGKSCQFTN